MIFDVDNIEVTQEACHFRYSSFSKILKLFNHKQFRWHSLFCNLKARMEVQKALCFLIWRKIIFRCWRRCSCPLIKGFEKTAKFSNIQTFNLTVTCMVVSIIGGFLDYTFFHNSTSDRFEGLAHHS